MAGSENLEPSTEKEFDLSLSRQRGTVVGSVSRLHLGSAHFSGSLAGR